MSNAWTQKVKARHQSKPCLAVKRRLTAVCEQDASLATPSFITAQRLKAFPTTRHAARLASRVRDHLASASHQFTKVVPGMTPDTRPHVHPSCYRALNDVALPLGIQKRMCYSELDAVEAGLALVGGRNAYIWHHPSP